MIDHDERQILVGVLDPPRDESYQFNLVLSDAHILCCLQVLIETYLLT